jgi:membrane protease YdiL (CAAX protease family)
MRIKSEGQAIVFSIIIAAIGIFSLYLSKEAFGEAPLTTIGGPRGYLIPVGITAILIFALRRQRTIRLDGSFLAGFKRGAYIIAAGVIFLVIALLTAKLPYDPTFANVIFFIVSCLMTGLFEEFLCRGLIQEIMMEGEAAAGRSPWRAIILSSLIFGVLHFANLVTDPQMIVSTTTQAIYAFALGVILGTVYFKTRNIMSVVVLHGLFNILGSITDIFQEPVIHQGAGSDISLATASIELVIMLPAIYAARRIYLKAGR